MERGKSNHYGFLSFRADKRDVDLFKANTRHNIIPGSVATSTVLRAFIRDFNENQEFYKERFKDLGILERRRF